MPGLFQYDGVIEVVVPIPTDLNWPGVAAMTFTPDGEDIAWDLLGTSGIVLMSKGLRGLDMPPVKRYTESSPAVHGTRYRGYRLDERPVFWPLLVYTDEGSQAYVELERRLWETLEPDKLGTWTITRPDGTSRSLRVRFNDDSDHVSDRDPSRVGWEVYGIHLVAEDPFWEGDPINREWHTAAVVDFFGGTGGPPFYISSSADISTATMSNPGRHAVWPKWTIYGHTTSVDLGIEGHAVQVHIDVPVDKALVVDTDPTVQTAIQYDAPGKIIDYSTGVERTGELGETDFAPIPPGAEVTLALSMSGTGSVSAEVRPRYYRAW